jgi:predicted  nucleic acid-binding Zn-ribbon protein
MDVMDLLKSLQAAVAEAQTREKAQQAAHSKMTATVAAAKAQYEAVAKSAEAEFQAANQAYQDAKVAVERLKANANEALGGLFAAADARVRIG